MKKLIKNYTTEIAVEKTVSEIQEILGKNGARAVAVEYDNNGKVKDIFFKIILNNRDLAFRLPAKANKVYDALFADMYGQTQRLKEVRIAKAEAIAWRICKTWLEAQITLINLEQAKIQEVFLPYLVMPGDKTLYEVMEQSQFMLPSGNNPEVDRR